MKKNNPREMPLGRLEQNRKVPTMAITTYAKPPPNTYIHILSVFSSLHTKSPALPAPAHSLTHSLTDDSSLEVNLQEVYPLIYLYINTQEATQHNRIDLIKLKLKKKKVKHT